MIIQRLNIKSLMTAVFITATAFGCDKAETVIQKATPVKTEVIHMIETARSTHYSGNIVAGTEVQVSFKTGGYVNQILVEEGDTVKKGTVLARLEEDDYAAKVAGAEGQLEEANAALKQASADYNRAKFLFESQSITKPEYDSALAAYEMSLAKERIGRAALVQAEIARRDTVIKSPVDGLILHRSVEVGTLASPGTPAFVVADVSKVNALFGVADSIVPLLSVGETLVIKTESLPGQTFAGKISKIAPSADSRSRVFEIEVAIHNHDRKLKVGMIATLDLLKKGQQSKKSLLIPFSSIVRSTADSNKYGVFIFREATPPIVQFREISLGEVFGNRVEVTTGLTEGERIVTEGANTLKDGQQVASIQ